MFTGMDGNAAGCYLQFQLSREAQELRALNRTERQDLPSFTNMAQPHAKASECDFSKLPHGILIQH